MTEHARFAPSSAEQWINCPGSVSLQERFPDTSDNTDALDGVTCHAVATGALENGFSSVSGYLTSGLFVSSAVVTDDIIDAAQVYVSEVRRISGDDPVMVERKVSISAVHPTDCWGTLDTAYYDPRTGDLHIWDLKYGWGLVEVTENWQLALYALGLIEEMNPRPQRVVMRIVQPRPYHPDGTRRARAVRMVELLPFAGIAQVAVRAAESPEPHCKTGRYCKHCSALLQCDTARKAGLFVADMISGTRSAPVTPEQIGFELRLFRRLSEMAGHRLAAAEAAALAMARSGTEIPGWQIGTTAGKTEWAPAAATEILAVAEMFGVTVTAPSKLLTPNQVTKAGLPADVVAQYTVKKSGTPRMEPTNINKLAEVFKNG